MINGTYEDGVIDTLKFLKDNGHVEFDMPLDQFIALLSQLSERGDK